MPQTATAPIEFAPDTMELLRKVFESELRHRRLFIAGRFDLADRQLCTLVIRRPDGEGFNIQGEAVYVKADEPGAGVGLDLTELTGAKLHELETFVQATPPDPAASASAPKSLYESVRKLSLRERDQMGRQGSLPERVALERSFGSSVWEALLQNPQLSVPEVAHIAKNGTLPIPLAATIVGNSAWLASAEVRRALLSNPRVSGVHLERVLKAMPRLELKQVADASPYRSQVRAAAKKLLGQ